MLSIYINNILVKIRLELSVIQNTIVAKNGVVI